MSPKYENTFLYKIKCRDPLILDFYLGYSTSSQVRVEKMFETRCKLDMDWPVCIFVREHGGFENWMFERLPFNTCKNAKEARIELREHFNADPPTLNRQLPTRTNKEYSQTPKNKASQKQYRTEHLDKIHKDQAAFYLNNKEKLLQKRREYFEMNRDRINAQARNLRATRKAAREVAER